MTQAKNFNDVRHILKKWGYYLHNEYRNVFTKKKVLVFRTGNGQPHPVNMSYFIGSKFRLESADNRFYIVTRV